ncbi:hypothetical protein [Pontibacter sp. H249]|uniref:hypothetical protein n=1 Tax=Pontibacter sp. H249 TaxID=3133420 RepID=UPI0030BA9ACE
MAEINIERKKKPIWPWILLLVIVALLIWAIYELLTDDNTVAAAFSTADYMIPTGIPPLLV